MPVSFSNIDVNIKLKGKSIIREWISSRLLHYKRKTGNINIILTSDSYLLQLNQDHLGRNYLTDIITFNYNTQNTVSGDLFISLERVIANAAEYKVSNSNELLRVMMHGILHLVGFDDLTAEDKDLMRVEEEDALEKVKDLLVV